MALEPEMLAPVERLAGFMARGEPLDGVFADEVTIVENFPPFLFDGPGAAAR